MSKRLVIVESPTKARTLSQYLGDAHHPELLIYKVIPDDVLFMREWALEYHVVPTGQD